MSRMFFGCIELIKLDLSNFNTSKVTNMSQMFGMCHNLKELDVSNFDTSNVTNMGGMFSGSQVTELDLSSFDTSQVTDMSYMFAACNFTTIGYARTQVDADKFNDASVTEIPDTLHFVVKPQA